MNQIPLDNALETIVAPATAVGGGVAIVRLSGPRALAIVNDLFSTANRRELQQHELAYGTLTSSDGEMIDDCMAVVMPRPGSFTGEDVAEIHCHGGHAVVSAVVQASITAGARLAEPGEFSRRAFMNGKMDLAQAEALGDLIAAQTELSRRMALRQLQGGLSAEVRRIRDSLFDAAAEIEAHLDFPEEDIPAMAQDRIAKIMHAAHADINTLLKGFERGRLVREGARVVLAGLPNAGKSSLFNAIIGRERAIVSPHPGTTRDTIEATIDLGGVPVTFVDTAGLRDSTDHVEQIGIQRTSEELQGADLVLAVYDSSIATQDSLANHLPSDDSIPVIRVHNKSDMAVVRCNESEEGNLSVSATTREGIDNLLNAIAARLVNKDTITETTVTRARHAECLRLAAASLTQSEFTFTRHQSGDLVMVDLRDAIIHLGEILGERLDEQILDRIFSTFCLGK